MAAQSFGVVGLRLCEAEGGARVGVEALAMHRRLKGEGLECAGARDWFRRECKRWWARGEGKGCYIAYHDGAIGIYSEQKLWRFLNGRDLDGSKWTKEECMDWYPASLDSLLGKWCPHARLLRKIASVVRDEGYDGAPDLTIVRQSGVELVEVKSENDKLRREQARMMRALAEKCADEPVSLFVCFEGDSHKVEGAQLLSLRGLHGASYRFTVPLTEDSSPHAKPRYLYAVPAHLRPLFLQYISRFASPLFKRRLGCEG